MRSLILMGLLVFASSASAQKLVPPPPAPQSAGQELIQMQPFFTGLTGAANRQEMLPALDYWGVGTAIWGSAQSSAPSAPASGGGCSIAGRNCVLKTAYDQQKGLQSVTYAFADGVTDRAERLAIFSDLDKALVKAYGAASQSPASPENVRGQDAFVQGLENRYELRWTGPQTNVRLTMTPDELTIVYDAAPAGYDAAKRESDFRTFERIVEKFPASHPLKAIGRKKEP
jgi:hypothetical protein